MSKIATHENSVLVRFAPHITIDEQDAICEGFYGAYVQRDYEIVSGLTLVILPDGKTPQEALDFFKADDRSDSPVIFAEENGACDLSETIPNDPSLSWGLTKIKAPDAWDNGVGSTDVVVAVIDTGIDLDHEDLVNQLWVNPADLTGYPGYNFYDNTADPSDTNGHGTHVAGIIAAESGNEAGGCGVCPNAKIMALNVASGGTVYISAAVAAFEYAIANGAKIINCSWSTDYNYASLYAAVWAANQAGILVVCCAGNEERDTDVNPRYPASYTMPNIISVMSSGSDDTRAVTSNFGKTSVDVAAPGVAILSTWINNTYATKSGTSMAAPLVSGCAAYLLSHMPNLTCEQVKQILIDSCDAVASHSEISVSGGRVNLDSAITAALAFTAEEEDPPATEDAHTLSEIVPGREVIYKRSGRDQEDLLFDVEIEIVWRKDTQFSGITAITVNNGYISSVTELGYRATEAQVNAKRAAYGSLTVGQTGRFEAREAEGGLWNYSGTIITSTPVGECIVSADQVVSTGRNIRPLSADRICQVEVIPEQITFKINGVDTLMNKVVDATYGFVYQYVSGEDTIKAYRDDDQWTLLFVGQAEALAYAPNAVNDIIPKTGWIKGTSLSETPSVAYGYSWPDFKILLGSKISSARIEWNEDGTLNYSVALEEKPEQFYKDEVTELAVPDAELVAKGHDASGTPKEVLRFGTVGRKAWVEFGIKTDSLPKVILEDSDETDGLSRHIQSLSGITGQVPEISADGKYSWRINHELITVPDTSWVVHAIGREWVKKEISKTTSLQQIRRKVSGDSLYYSETTVDAAGNVITLPRGLPWNAYWSWISGYAYPAGYSVYRLGKIYTSKASVTSTTAPESDATNWEIAGNYPTYWVDGGYYARHGAWKEYWRKSYAGTGGAFIGTGHGALGYYGPYSDLLLYTAEGFKAGIDATKTYPVASTPDGKLYRIKYNTAVDLNAASATAAGALVRIPVCVHDWGGNFSVTETTSTIITGAKAIVSTVDNVTTRSVYLVLDTGKFYVAIADSNDATVAFTSNTCWEQYTAIYRYATAISACTPDRIGVYLKNTVTGNPSPTGFDAWFVLNFNWGAYGKSPSNATYGVGGAKEIWQPFSDEYIQGRIGVFGLGAFPDNNEDTKIETREALEEEAVWNNEWSWAPGTYALGTVKYHLGSLWKATGDPTTNGVPGTSGWALTYTDQPYNWVESGKADRYGPWNHGWRKSYAGAALSAASHGGSMYQGIYSANTLYNAQGLPGGVDAIQKYPVASMTDGKLYRLKYNTGVAANTASAKTAGQLVRIPVCTHNYGGTPNPLEGTSMSAVPTITPTRTVYLNTTTGDFYVALLNLPYGESDPVGFTNETYWKKYTASYRYATVIRACTPDRVGIYEAGTPVNNFTYTGVDAWFQINFAWGAYGKSPDNATYGAAGTTPIWQSFADADLSGKISLVGIGTFPENTPMQLALISEEGSPIYANSARVQYYSNAHENPEWYEAGQRLRHYEDTIVLRTYFAVDPLYVTNKRIPESIADFGNELFHKDDPNISAEYKTIAVGDLFAIEAIIIRKGEISADTPTASSSSEDGATITGTKANMDGSQRNFPQVDADGYWGLHHRIPEVTKFTPEGAVTGKPTGTFKDVS